LEAQSLARKFEIKGLEQVIDEYLDSFCDKNDYLDIYSYYKKAGDEKRSQLWMKVKTTYIFCI